MIEAKNSSVIKRLSNFIFNRYVLFTMLAFLIISIPVTLFISNSVVKLSIKAYENASVGSVKAIFESATKGSPIDEPLTGKEYNDFSKFFDELEENTNYKVIVVWTTDGTLVYCSNPNAMLGKKREISGNFAKALKGKRISEIERGAKVEVNGGELIGDALEVYFPIYDTNGKEIINVFEIYAPLTAINKTLASTRSALVGLFAFLFIIMAIYAETVAAVLTSKNQGLKSLTEKLEFLSVTDGLTNIYNHRYFRDALKNEYNRSKRLNKNLGLIMIDMDYFKTINDVYGHQTGDAVLEKVARTIEANIRIIDTVARYGGEEFVVILPESNDKECLNTAERLRKSIEEIDISVDGEKLKITASFGVAVYPDCADTESDLVNAADSALLIAKEQGKNSVLYSKTKIAL